MRVRVDSSLDAHFLLHQLLGASGRAYFERVARGTSGSMVKIDRALLEHFPLLVPPLSEQRRIAAFLTAVDETIEKTETVIERLRDAKRALMEQLLTRGMPGRHTSFRSSQFGDIPVTWSMRLLDQLVQRIQRAVELEAAGSYREIGVRSFGRGVFHKAPVDGAALGTKKVYWVDPASLVINTVFAWEGAIAATSDDERGMIASHRFPMLRPLAGALDLSFARLLLQSRHGVDLMRSHSPGGAGRNKTLNVRALLATRIPVPPIAEQVAIGEVITSTERQLVAEQGAAARLRILKSALSAALLSGELRVDHLPEPR